LGRFAQADTIVPGGVQGLDRYAYVYNSPIQYNDPTGHFPKPVYVFLSINLATSGIPQNPPDMVAQYNYAPTPGLPSGHYNLCGDIALSMIYETATGQVNTLGYIYQGSRYTTRETGAGTNPAELATIFAMTFPVGWRALVYNLSDVQYFEAGNQYAVWQGSARRSLTQYSSDEIKRMITSMLLGGNYVVTLVSQDTAVGGGLKPRGDGTLHWVDIYGVTDKYVYINNPFTNRKERYTWSEFLSSFSYALIEIIPPESASVMTNAGALIPQ
jgi:hypothetical protein